MRRAWSLHLAYAESDVYNDIYGSVQVRWAWARNRAPPYILAQEGRTPGLSLRLVLAFEDDPRRDVDELRVR